MAVLNAIKQMKAQGYSDIDIINNLQQQGISPREINEAIAQSNVKQAVYEGGNSESPQQTQEAGYGQMESSIMSTQEESDVPKPGAPVHKIQQQTYPSYAPPQQTYSQQPVYEGEYPPQYSDYQNYAASPDMITEIANQIFLEKIDKTNKNINTLIELKTLLTAKVEKIDERLKQIESIIDQLQMSILRKSTEQEQNVEDIKNEMRMVQQSFGKMLNPLADQVREIEKTSTKKEISYPKKTTLKKVSKKRI